MLWSDSFSSNLIVGLTLVQFELQFNTLFWNFTAWMLVLLVIQQYTTTGCLQVAYLPPKQLVYRWKILPNISGVFLCTRNYRCNLITSEKNYMTAKQARVLRDCHGVWYRLLAARALCHTCTSGLSWSVILWHEFEGASAVCSFLVSLGFIIILSPVHKRSG